MTQQQIVFVIGAARSGTKFARSLFSADASSVAIPYDIGYVWRYKNEGLPHDEIDSASLSDSDLAVLRRRVEKMFRRASGGTPATFYFEKSVPNSLRPDLLHRVFPEAKFLHLVRNGFPVAESALRQWQAPVQSGYLLQKLKYLSLADYRYAFWFLKNRLSKPAGQSVPIWGPRYNGIQHDTLTETLPTVVAKQWLNCVEKSLTGLDVVPKNKVFTMSYGDLVSKPSIVQDACDFMGMSALEPLAYQHAHAIQGEDMKWEKRLLPSELSDIRAVLDGASTRAAAFLE